MIKVGDTVKIKDWFPYILYRLGYNRTSIFKVKGVYVKDDTGEQYLTFDGISDSAIFDGLNADAFDIIEESTNRKSRIESLKL